MRTKHNRALFWTSLVLVLVGAFNWLLVGLFGFNLVAAIFGAAPILERLIYVVVGLAGIYLLWHVVSDRRPAGAAPRRATF